MLLKSRREFTLCFFLFWPLGMAGYTAETLNEGSGAVEGNITSKVVRNLASQPGAKPHAATAPERGGQAAPVSASGGLSGAERVSRLLVDGRKAYRDGDLQSARTRFQQALSYDSANSEAKRYLAEIERNSAGSQFAADSPVGGLPVKRNTPAPASSEQPNTAASSKSVKQNLSSASSQVALNASESLSGDSQRFSKTMTQADSFTAPKTAALKKSDKANAADVEKTPVQVASLAKASVAGNALEAPKVASIAADDADAASPAPQKNTDSKAPAQKPEPKSPVVEPAAEPKTAKVLSIPQVASGKHEAIKPVVVAKIPNAEKAKSETRPSDDKPAEDSKSAEAASVQKQPAVAAKAAAKQADAAKQSDDDKAAPVSKDVAVAANATGTKQSVAAKQSDLELNQELVTAFEELEAESAQLASTAKPQAAQHPAQPMASEPKDSLTQAKTNTQAPEKKLEASEKKAEASKGAEQKPEPAKSSVKTDTVPKEVKTAVPLATEKPASAKDETAATAKDEKSDVVKTEKNTAAAQKASSEKTESAKVPEAPAVEKKTSIGSANLLKKAEARKTSAEAGAAIKLYNEGKYDEAASRLKALLANDPADAEAKDYLQRAEKKLANAQPKEAKPAAAAEAAPKPVSANPPLLDLAKLKEAAAAVAKAAEAPKDEPRQIAQAPVELKPLGEALSTDSSKPATSTAPDKNAATESKKSDSKPADSSSKPADSSAKPAASAATPSATDPIVEADKLTRQAQREMQEGKRDAALSTARQAAALDANNVEAKALVGDLSGTSPAGSQAKSLPSLQSLTAPVPASPAMATASEPAPAVVGPVGIDALLIEGRNKYQSGKLRESLTSFKAILEKDPTNSEARDYVTRIEAERGTGDEAIASAVPDKDAPKPENGVRISAQKKAQDAESGFQQGLVAYQAGKLDVAVQHWNYALTLDSSHPRAIQYLEQTRSEYDAWVQQHQYNALELQKEVGATEKLDTSVTYDTAGQKTIVEFLSAMSLITDISFYVTDGVDPEIRVTAKFEDQPLHDALDVVLLPIGLKWSRTSDVVTVTPDLRTKFFNLTPEQVGRLKTLLENKTLQRYLYGPEGVPPMRNVELTLDDRENLLSVTDSQENISKIEAFVKDLQANGPTQLVYKNWKIRPEEGAKIKALVEAIVRVQSDAPFDLERKVVVDGDDLIVKDIADNVAKIEQLLLDKNFLRKLETQKLSVASYNLTPREPLKDNVEQVRDLSQSIVTVIKTILYAQSTESAAAAEGRRYWFDPNTLQLTVTDYPENLRVVGDYIRSLPMLGSDKQKSEIIFLKHQTVSEMVDLLTRVLGLSGEVDATGGATGDSVTKTLRVEGELTFRDLKIRITKVNENDLNNDNDDSVEMVVRTATSSEDRTIEEFRSDFIDEYELNVIEVRPSSTPGEGSVRLEIRYSPGGQAGLAAPPAVTPLGAAGVGGAGTVVGPDGQLIQVPGIDAAEETTLQVEPIDNMNALLIRYEDPADLSQVKSWLEQLDIPVLQVSIETKLVEVNETRVKQFMPKFNILNLGRGGFDMGNNFNSVNGLQEFGSIQNFTPDDPNLPMAWNAQNTDLLNPVSVFNIITGGDTPLNFTLRMLESEGVLNMVNGPHITVENGESASFEIELTAPGLARASIDTTQQQTGGAAQAGALQQVQLEVTPQITQIGEIRLDLQNLELNDRGHHLAETVTIHEDLSGDGAAQTPEPVYWARAYAPGSTLFDNRRRALQTVARVQNHGTIVLGGWTGEHSLTRDAGIPILRNLPYVGKLLFGQTADEIEKTNLLIFLTCHLIEP
ncbi:MAG: hypothetical protein ACR2IE_20325 [Candidatus Sumerlaeaceae bacterium]